MRSETYVGYNREQQLINVRVRNLNQKGISEIGDPANEIIKPTNWSSFRASSVGKAVGPGFDSRQCEGFFSSPQHSDRF
jgi:hypothetical protein